VSKPPYTPLVSTNHSVELSFCADSFLTASQVHGNAMHLLHQGARSEKRRRLFMKNDTNSEA